MIGARGMRPDQAPRATEVIRHGRRLCHYTPTETLLMNWRFHANNRTRLDGTTHFCHVDNSTDACFATTFCRFHFAVRP